MERSYDIEDLKRLMERLRDPQFGCPWDLKQTYQSIAPFTLEECLELIDALEQSDYEHVEEELGDLLFQVIFYSQLGKEDGRFDFDSVVSGITAKLLRRHPHVFKDGELEGVIEDRTSMAAIKANWEKQKPRSVRTVHKRASWMTYRRRLERSQGPKSFKNGPRP